jgi:Protein of unknown function (DUF2934)
MSKSSPLAMKKNAQSSTPATVAAESASPTVVDGAESRGESANAAADAAPIGHDAQSATESGIESANREDLIRQAAYRRFKERGTPHGDEVQDWLEAEAEINQSLVE